MRSAELKSAKGVPYMSQLTCMDMLRGVQHCLRSEVHLCMLNHHCCKLTAMRIPHDAYALQCTSPGPSGLRL